MVVAPSAFLRWALGGQETRSQSLFWGFFFIGAKKQNKTKVCKSVFLMLCIKALLRDPPC